MEGGMKAVAMLAGVALAAAACGASAADKSPPLITIDTHVDIPDAYMRVPRYDAGKDSTLLVDLGKMERGGLDAAFFVIYVAQGPEDEAGRAAAVAAAERKYEGIERLVAQNPTRIAFARTPAQVRANKAAGKLSALIGIENGYSLGHDLKRLDAAYARGARYLGVVHVGNNDLCGSSAPAEGEPANTGLTDFGAAAVARANQLGMLVDISHASDACIHDVLRASKAPIIASHSSARALVDHKRNLTDEELRLIAANGGVAQAVAYREFVKADPERYAAEEKLKDDVAKAAGDAEFDSEKHDAIPAYVRGMAKIEARWPRATLSDFLDHVVHMVKVAGVDHVGIASDFDGGGGVTGWMDASETANVAAGLRKRGFGDGDIAKIWGGNLLRAWEQADVVAGRLSRAPVAVAPARSDDAFGAIVDEVVARYHLPGISVGVIEDGKVTHAITRGELVAGSGRAVTPDSIFKIASNSKAMTASVLARLVQAGKLKWDDPVVKYLPGFRLGDDWVTQHLVVRDLLVHDSGLPEGGGDLMLWPEPNEFTRADILAGLAHIKPAYGFRAGYAYDNTLYIVAGEVAAAAGGASYEELVRREIFEPLGLTHCLVGGFRLADAGEIAQPHRRQGEGNVPLNPDAAWVAPIASAAAGGIRCSLGDMLAWANNWLAPTPAQLQWLGPEQRAQMWAARTPMPISARRRAWDNTHSLAYAFGFRLADMDGEWTVSHTGTLSGMYSAMLLLPDRRSGFVMMTNGDGDAARTVITEALLAQLLKPGQGRSVAALADELESAAAAPSASHAADTSARVPATPAAMAPWLGVWRDPWLGAVSICADKEKVRWIASRSPRLAGQVMAVGKDLIVQWDGEGMDESWLRFSQDRGARRLRMAKTDPDADFSSDYEDLDFTRIGDCDGVSAASTAAEAGLVDVPAGEGIALDIRYAGTDNFTGARVDGYEAPRCWLRPSAANALQRVSEDLRSKGLRVRIFDCYRPTRAVSRFLAWAAQPEQAAARAKWHPHLDKRALVPDYIADVSGHSRGATLDLGLERCAGQHCAALDMGTPFDLFDPSANTDSPDATAEQHANRLLLKQAMAAEGFENYDKEWWHYTWQPEAVARIRFDVPVR
jgi:microsomal dipeptidase-like Zn-dependent dipeptidase/CubicO group peptidase (beta-lactamase class C family)/D-alanyl-D-alanine dipeptidase